MIKTFFNGLSMAVADSVPGVSGGTIAFILGFYDRFIEALHNLFGKDKTERKSALLYLMKLGIGWCVGMGVCVLLLSNLFAQNIYFMSSVFLGLTATAIPFVIVAEKTALKGRYTGSLFALLGAAAVVGISLMRGTAGAIGSLDFLSLQPLHLIYIFFSGMIAIAAMVLPGISGSTVLLIAGVYLPTINAVKGLMAFHFAELPGLLALGCGVLFGICISIHVIRRALKRHRSQMIYLILGLMAGSLFAIVMGPTTLAEPVPALSLSTFNIFGFILGIAVLLGLELLGKIATKKKSSIDSERMTVHDER